jgi:acetyltransferase-like isoleucine patch superfamily enzyme
VHVLPGARVGAACNLCDGVYVEGKVTIGDRVTVKNGVALYDLVTVEDDVFIGPNAAFTNDLVPRAIPHRSTPDQFLPTRLRRGATIGANATVICGHEVGQHALVGAGAVVTRDVPAHAIVQGNPARFAGWICACGKRLPDDLACTCGKRYRKAAGGLELEPARP